MFKVNLIPTFTLVNFKLIDFASERGMARQINSEQNRFMETKLGSLKAITYV